MDCIKKEHKKFSKNSYASFALGCDIGGTNAKIGVFGAKKKPELLVSFRFKSKELKNIYSAVNYSLGCMEKEHGIKITKACFGAAGAVSPERYYVHLTNAKLGLSAKELARKTALKKILLINDFEAIGYGINMLSEKDVKTIKKAWKIPKAPVVAIGAGTGLGKTLLIYDVNKKMYIPVPSEVHHAYFAAQNSHELKLADFIKKRRKIKFATNGDVLSGEGLESIYLFLRQSKKFKETKFTKEIGRSKTKPELISKYRKIDKTCKEAFKIFKTAYAKFAKNMALDALAFGGVYIAGGIAQKNSDIFDMEFVKIFGQSDKMRDILARMPIYLITNYDIGLIGAGFAGVKFL